MTGTVNGLVTDEWGFSAEIQLKDDSRYTSYAWYSDTHTGAFVADAAFELCPKDHPNGIYVVTGYAWMTVAISDTWAWAESPFPNVMEFTVSPMTTVTTLAPLPTVVGTLSTFSGKVSVTSPTTAGVVPDPAGRVAIETGSGDTWTPIGFGNPDATGAFAIPVGTVLPPGSQYRASYEGTKVSSPSRSSTQSIPTPPVVQPSPTVKVKAVSGRSKLKVDVNPNKGRKYWTFQVQRKKADGKTWKPLKTYKTYGSAEKRTINLPKGTYRVFVNPKFGYQGATSAEIVLKR